MFETNFQHSFNNSKGYTSVLPSYATTTIINKQQQPPNTNNLYHQQPTITTTTSTITEYQPHRQHHHQQERQHNQLVVTDAPREPITITGVVRNNKTANKISGKLKENQTKKFLTPTTNIKNWFSINNNYKETTMVNQQQQQQFGYLVPWSTLVIMLFSSGMLVLFGIIHRSQPFAYIDEIFHIPQAQQYCLQDTFTTVSYYYY